VPPSSVVRFLAAWSA